MNISLEWSRTQVAANQAVRMRAIVAVISLAFSCGVPRHVPGDDSSDRSVQNQLEWGHPNSVSWILYRRLPEDNVTTLSPLIADLQTTWDSANGAVTAIPEMIAMGVVMDADTPIMLTVDHAATAFSAAINNSQISGELLGIELRFFDDSYWDDQTQTMRIGIENITVSRHPSMSSANWSWDPLFTSDPRPGIAEFAARNLDRNIDLVDHCYEDENIRAAIAQDLQSTQSNTAARESTSRAFYSHPQFDVAVIHLGKTPREGGIYGLGQVDLATSPPSGEALMVDMAMNRERVSETSADTYYYGDLGFNVMGIGGQSQRGPKARRIADAGSITQWEETEHWIGIYTPGHIDVSDPNSEDRKALVAGLNACDLSRLPPNPFLVAGNSGGALYQLDRSKTTNGVPTMLLFGLYHGFRRFTVAEMLSEINQAHIAEDLGRPWPNDASLSFTFSAVLNAYDQAATALASSADAQRLRLNNIDLYSWTRIDGQTHYTGQSVNAWIEDQIN